MHWSNRRTDHIEIYEADDTVDITTVTNTAHIEIHDADDTVDVTTCTNMAHTGPHGRLVSHADTTFRTHDQKLRFLSPTVQTSITFAVVLLMNQNF